MEFVMHAQDGDILGRRGTAEAHKSSNTQKYFLYLRWGVGDGLEQTGSCAEQRTSEDLVLRPGPAPRGRTNIKWTM